MPGKSHHAIATLVALGLASSTHACGRDGPPPAKQTPKAATKAAAKADQPPEAGLESGSTPRASVLPKPKPPHVRLSKNPTPDFSILVAESGTVVMDESGQLVDLLINGRPDWCRVDPRSEVLWFHLEGDNEPLQMLPLEAPGPPVEVLASMPEVLVIAYPNEQLGRPPDHQFASGVALHVERPPRVEAILGCDGDMAWACFGDDVEDFEAARTQRLAEDRKALAATPLQNTDVLAELAAHSKGRRVAQQPDPERSPVPQAVPGVPRDGCEEVPEDCGTARRLTGTRLWLVVVGNSRGDFFHQTVQPYDPLTKKFVDPRDPSSGSATPLPEDKVFIPSWVSPSGEQLFGDGVLVDLGKGIVAHGLRQSCGFWGGGWEIDSGA